MPLSVRMLVAHVHPAGHTTVVFTFRNQLVESSTGKKLAAEPFEFPHIPVHRYQVERIAMAVCRSARPAYSLVELRATIAGNNAYACHTKTILFAVSFPRFTQRVQQRFYRFHDMCLYFRCRRVVYTFFLSGVRIYTFFKCKILHIINFIGPLYYFVCGFFFESDSSHELEGAFCQFLL